MNLLVVGFNHKTASVELRERCAFDEARSEGALSALHTLWPDGQFVLLSTCNRTELYVVSAGEAAGPTGDDLGRFFSRFAGLDPADLGRHLYVHHDAEAVDHLLAVTCSLDSLVVGEPQILAQVKDAYRLACRAGVVGKITHRLFHCAFATAKEVYATTSIAQRRVSIAGVAVELASHLFADLARARVLLVGAGEMGELLLRHLLDMGCRPENIHVAARTGRHVEALERRYGVNIEPTGAWLGHVGQVDLVITAATVEPTVASSYLCDRKAFSEAMGHRPRGSLLCIDIAVPRNLDPAIGELENVFLYCIDDLAGIARQHLDARVDDLETAREIIADNVESFLDWFALRDIGPLVGRLRSHFQEISRGELEKFLRADPDLSPLARRQLEVLVARTVNKLLHGVIQSLHHIAREQGSDQAVRFIESVLHEEPR